MEKIELEIGPGLFTDSPVEVPVEFPSGTATFRLKALTADLVAGLEKEGFTFDNVETSSEAIERAGELLDRLVFGWEGLTDVNGTEIPYTDENRRKLAASPVLVAEIWRICSRLAVRKHEVESGNSET